ncbi:MAG: glycosyltransferase [Gemmataceae bacterium]
MRIALPTTGSRGDVQPFVALGLGLQAAGHKVLIATHADFEDFVHSHGLDFYPIEDNARALQASEAGDRMIHAGEKPFLFMREFAKLRVPIMNDLMRNCWEACRDADTIILSNTAPLLGQAVAEKAGIPTCLASLQPTALSRYLPNCFMPEPPRWMPSGIYNPMSHVVTAEYLWQLVRSAVNKARQEVLGLPPLPFLGPAPGKIWGRLRLFGYSPLVVAKPPDWDADHHVTGYWFLDDGLAWDPPTYLEDFLQAGQPPVYIGFGTCHNRDAEKVTDIVIRALEDSGQRGILMTGWDGLRRVDPTDRILSIESVPHDWLFPRTAAVVHHGGAGTTSATLRAGVPGIVVPFTSDQPFWGRRVFQLGLGPRPVPRSELSVERLAEAIREAVGNPALRLRATEVGRQIRAEDGVGRAVELFQEYIGHQNDRNRPTAMAETRHQPALT